ncbi:MAG TPA: hypothetical protein DCL38_02880 [Lachnospiraceae bacterium]|nr:hypothetical protein [Lachnospiraceae bacterium]
MYREAKAYIRNIIRKESFYIDILSTLIGLAVIVLTAVAFIAEAEGLIRVIFILALVLSAMNVYKGFKLCTPTRYIYAVFTVILVFVSVYSLL